MGSGLKGQNSMFSLAPFQTNPVYEDIESHLFGGIDNEGKVDNRTLSNMVGFRENDQG